MPASRPTPTSPDLLVCRVAGAPCCSPWLRCSPWAAVSRPPTPGSPGARGERRGDPLNTVLRRRDVGDRSNPAAPRPCQPRPCPGCRGCPGARHCDGCAGDAAGQGRAAKTGYEREVFGQAWADVDRNGCDTRNDILRRDLTAYVLKAGTRGCLVLRGSLRRPYTGTTIAFVRGEGTSAWVQIDHVVALSDAWQKGAQQLSFAPRAACSPTTPSTCWPSTARATSARATVTPRPGCLRSGATAAPTSRGRSPSRPATGCG